MAKEDSDMKPSSHLLQRQSTASRCYQVIITDTVKREFKETAKLSLPLIFTQLSFLWMQPIATVFAGHLGKLELDSVALANALISSFGVSVVYGLVTGGDTVFAQTFGAENNKLMGLHLQRCLFIGILGLMPCFALYLNMEAILLITRQDRHVASMVGRYLLISMPGLFFMFLGVIFRSYMQAQNIVRLHIIIGALGLGVHATAQYLLLYQFHLGIEGSSLAQTLAYFVVFILTLRYMITSGVYQDTWFGWDIRCLTELGPLVKISLFGLAMLCLEWWCFDITLVLAGVLGTTELAVQSIMWNLDMMFYCIPDGLSIATCIRTGQYLGAGQPDMAKLAARVGMAFLACTSLVVSGIMGMFRHQLPYIYSDVPEVVNMAAMMLPFVAFYTFFDNMTCIGRGVMLGSGQQSLGTAIIFSGFYLLAMPVGIPLMFATSLGLIGLWIGMSLGLMYCGLVYIVYINWFAKWKDLALQARQRAGLCATSGDKGTTEENSLVVTNNSLDGFALNEENTEPAESSEITRAFIFKRVLAISGPILLLIIGILCRVSLHLPDVQDHFTNIDIYNGTDVSLYNTTLGTDAHI